MNKQQTEMKEYLSQAFRIDQRIQSKMEQVASLNDLATRATATYSDMPGSETRNLHRMEDAILSIIELEAEINGGICKLVQTKKDIRLAATALFTQNPGRHMCLCHGAAGNLLIMNRYLSKYGKHNQTYVRTYEALLSDLLLHMPEYAKDLVYESQNPGFMNGLAGVGYALLELYKEGSKY